MRTLLVLLVAAVALAGCASNNNGNGGSSGNNTNSTGGGMNNMTMSTPVATDSHDYSTCAVPSGTPLPAGCAPSKAITVPSSVSMLNLTVEWSAAQGAPAAPVGPDGANVKLGSVTCSLPPGPFTGAPKCTKNVAASGVTKIEYSGEGGVVAKVTVTGG
jgi:hypothetical protein